MKKSLAVMAVILCMMTAAACSGVDIDTLKHDAKGAVKIVKDSAEYSDKYKDIDVHTESEMREFALDALKSKYGKDFVIDESFCKYNHRNGKDTEPMQLRARAYPAGDPDDMCGIKVVEPNDFSDTYSVNKYIPAVTEYLEPGMSEYGVEGIIDIGYPAMTGIMEDGLSAEDVINDGQTCINFYQPTELKADTSEYIPEIRKWLEYLYTCDFEWYFALVDENDRYTQYAGISKGDHRYTSADQWTDDNLLELIDACINLID